MADIFETYKAADLDEAGATKYYGFLSRSGAWYIMRSNDVAYRYTRGSSDYVTNWTNRESLTYDYINVVFG